MLSERRLAIVLRMFERGSSWPGVIDGPAGAGRGAAAGREAAAPEERAGAAPARGPDHDSMSRLMIRPPGPLPATDERSMFWCAAMLRARGLAFTRPPSPLLPALAATGAGAGAGRAAGGGGTAGVFSAAAAEAG